MRGKKRQEKSSQKRFIDTKKTNSFPSTPFTYTKNHLFSRIWGFLKGTESEYQIKTRNSRLHEVAQ